MPAFDIRRPPRCPIYDQRVALDCPPVGKLAQMLHCYSDSFQIAFQASAKNDPAVRYLGIG